MLTSYDDNIKTDNLGLLALHVQNPFFPRFPTDVGAGYWGTSADPVSLGPSGVTGVCVVISLQSPLEERHHGEKQHQVRASRVWGTGWTDAGVIGRGQKGQVRGEISFRVWASQICDAHATPSAHVGEGTGRGRRELGERAGLQADVWLIHS